MNISKQAVVHHTGRVPVYAVVLLSGTLLRAHFVSVAYAATPMHGCAVFGVKNKFSNSGGLYLSDPFIKPFWFIIMGRSTTVSAGRFHSGLLQLVVQIHGERALHNRRKNVCSGGLACGLAVQRVLRASGEEAEVPTLSRIRAALAVQIREYHQEQVNKLSG